MAMTGGAFLPTPPAKEIICCFLNQWLLRVIIAHDDDAIYVI